MGERMGVGGPSSLSSSFSASELLLVVDALLRLRCEARSPRS